MTTTGARIAGVTTCLPTRQFDNTADASEFSAEEVRKVVGMAGVVTRRLAGDAVCSSDLCIAAGQELLTRLDWDPDSVDALIMVTQTPDYFLPSTSSIVHYRLGLDDHCAAFDVGLGCSGYPYGLWLASMMVQNGGMQRVLVMHGETPTRFVDNGDRSVALLFGDAGSATAVEASDRAGRWHFALHSDGSGYGAMIVEAGGFRNRFSQDERKYCLEMDGAQVFNFTIKRIPALVGETLRAAGATIEDIDYFIFHQSNQFIIRHIVSKLGLATEKVPVTIQKFGNTGGVSVPLTLTQGELERPAGKTLRLILLGYGVGLSWGGAFVELDPETILGTIELDNVAVPA